MICNGQCTILRRISSLQRRHIVGIINVNFIWKNQSCNTKLLTNAAYNCVCMCLHESSPQKISKHFLLANILRKAAVRISTLGLFWELISRYQFWNVCELLFTSFNLLLAILRGGNAVCQHTSYQYLKQTEQDILFESIRVISSRSRDPDVWWALIKYIQPSVLCCLYKWQFPVSWLKAARWNQCIWNIVRRLKVCHKSRSLELKLK